MSPGLYCEDCGAAITEATGYRPLDLFRPDAASQADVVWDATKQQFVVRPGAARAGGRRFRVVDLCRRCAAEALRRRAATSPKVGHKGRGGVLSVRDRVPPRRGGRPRLLSDDELRAAHVFYERGRVSRLEVARRLHATRGGGTVAGYASALLYGWRRLRLPLRPVGETIGLARWGTDGTKSKPPKRRCADRTAAGAPCRQYARVDSPWCRSHHPQHTEAAA